MRDLGSELDPPLVEPPPQAAAVRTRERVTAPAAAALILRMFSEAFHGVLEAGEERAQRPAFSLRSPLPT
ncbi:hypothetical protein GCM10010433_62870 [Streptomyces pulveraceus]